MRKQGKNRISRIVSMALGAILTVSSLSSCESFFEDLDPCPHGVSLRFVYEYHMEMGGNAFPANVDCLTLLIHDSEGGCVGTRTVTGPELQDEEYRMRMELAPGTYRFTAYGGMACDKASFSFAAPEPGAGTEEEDVAVKLDADPASPGGKPLHGLYYGSLELETADLYSEGTVEMMKNTNDIRIMLQHVSGEPVSASDFEFAIGDDNTLFDRDNDLIPAGTVSYAPWAQGEVSSADEKGGRKAVAAYAEFSVSRLMTKNATSSRLTVSRTSDGGKVIDIPLINYLLMLKSEQFQGRGDQEFLDRMSRWSLVFFLDENGSWLKTSIYINGWKVNIDEAEW